MTLVPKIVLGHETSQDDTKDQEVKKIEKNFTDPETQVVYERLPISSDSVLARFEGLYQERITAHWVDVQQKRLVDLYHYGFEMQEKKD